MTRAEMRRQAKASEKASKQFNMTLESFENSLQQAREQSRQISSEYAVKHFSTALAIVLHDKWDFKRDNLKSALLQIADMYDSISRGYVNDSDIRAVILAETGLDLDKPITSKS